MPYDVRRGPLVRPRLIRFPGDHHRLYLAMHHLVFDGVSLSRVILPELVALYEAARTGRDAELARRRPDTSISPAGSRRASLGLASSAGSPTGASVWTGRRRWSCRWIVRAPSGPSLAAERFRCRCPARR